LQWAHLLHFNLYEARSAAEHIQHPLPVLHDAPSLSILTVPPPRHFNRVTDPDISLRFHSCKHFDPLAWHCFTNYAFLSHLLSIFSFAFFFVFFAYISISCILSQIHGIAWRQIGKIYYFDDYPTSNHHPNTSALKKPPKEISNEEAFSLPVPDPDPDPMLIWGEGKRRAWI
jgi:hypothetical protein